METTRDLLAEAVAEEAAKHGDQVQLTRPDVLGSACPVCGRIFEPGLIDATTKRVLIPGHIPGHPQMCQRPAKGPRDARQRR